VVAGAALKRVTDALERHGCQRHGHEMWICPAHDDHNPSLSVKEDSKRVYLRCFAGCEDVDVLGKINLSVADLFDDRPARAKGPRPRAKRVTEYVYCDANGVPLRRKVRFEPGLDGSGKSFMWEKPAGKGWAKATGGAGNPHVLYRLPELLNALAAGDRTYIAAGEKDADRLRQEGWPATTNPEGEGAKKWKPEYSEIFRGTQSEVIVLADRDLTGYQHGTEVLKGLREIGVKPRCLEAVEGKDVTNHLDAGHSLDDLAEIDPAERLTGPGEEGAAAARPDLDSVAFSGKRFLSLLQRPEPEPIYAGVPVPGHLWLVVAPAFTGKSSLAYWNAMARARGVSPWDGAPARDPGRVLLYSIDEAPEQVARRMNGLATFHPAKDHTTISTALPLTDYASNIVVIGPDRDTDPDALEGLRFDEQGLATLRAWLEEANEAGRPFAEVYIDAYADMLPLGETENSNEAATQIGGGLERLAVQSGAAITLLHHSGKPRADQGEGLPDVRFLGRGASALAAKARVTTSLEAIPGMPHFRRMRTLTNLGMTPKDMTFQVCPKEGDNEGLLYFRPHDPLTDYRPEDFLNEKKGISTNKLAWALAGKEPVKNEKPPTDFYKLATRLRERWLKAGLIVVEEGSHGAKEARLA